MKLSDVLQRVEGLNKRFVYYLEAQGYIRPEKVRKQRIARREYSADDLRTIQSVWTYYQRGASVQNAYAMAQRAAQSLVHALLTVPPRRWGDALELLRSHDRVVSAAVVYGESANLIATLRAAEEVDVYAVLNELFDRSDLTGVPQIRRALRHYRREACDGAAEGITAVPVAAVEQGEQVMRAYVLIRVPGKHIETVLEQLRQFEGITEASVLYGETDILAKIEVPNQDALDDLVMRKIQDIDTVETTRTFICVGGLHWQR